ncbi:diguanylate cyclase, partial [Rhodovulum sulfidophilum]|nr:diguanylate cyclase [Rhodovulum sulfidophilum]
MQLSGRSSSGLGRAGQLLRRPEVLAFLPALSLLAYWLGGERTLVFVALGLPLFYATVGAFRPAAPSVTPDGLALRPQVIASLDRMLQDREGTGRK